MDLPWLRKRDYKQSVGCRLVYVTIDRDRQNREEDGLDAVSEVQSEAWGKAMTKSARASLFGHLTIHRCDNTT